MGLRVGAIWALIGFAIQCFIAFYTHDTLESGLRRALVHYCAWGVLGYLVGTLIERAIQDSHRNTMNTQQPPPPSTPSEND